MTIVDLEAARGARGQRAGACDLLSDRIREACRGDERALDRLRRAEPTSWRDLVLTLLYIYELHTAPLDQLGEAARRQHHPVVARIKTAAEEELTRAWDERLPLLGDHRDERCADTIRRIAAPSSVPPAYAWLATEADHHQLVRFLAMEGGPDGGFDDLVSVCQLGLDGEPKLALARNYWDEMGRGNADEVHTQLHRKLTRSLWLRPPEPSALPVAALERSALGGLLATNRALQPEMIGALGVIELQAGPRCRRVLEGLERIGADNEATAFYAEHAVADPRHGKDWLDNVVNRLADRPGWAEKMIRGARWRGLVNDAFLAAVVPMAAAEGHLPDHALQVASRHD